MVTVPLLVLAIPSLLLGLFLIEPLLIGDYFGSAIYVSGEHNVLSKIAAEYHGIVSFITHAFLYPPVYLAFSGLFVAWLCYIKYPSLPGKLVNRIGFIHKVLVNKYGFDDFNQIVFAGGVRKIGYFLSQFGDIKMIDGVLVNGSARSVRILSNMIRHIQSGYLYHYAFAIIIGLLLLLAIFVHGVGY